MDFDNVREPDYQMTSPQDNGRMINSAPRRMPFASHPEFRLFELNKHLQQRPEDADNTWWDSFASEFFEEDAEMHVQICVEDVPKDYQLGRTVLPRFFRSLFDGGVSDVQFTVSHPTETCVNRTLRLECDNALMIATHTKPTLSKVFTEGKLMLEFGYDELARIRTWHFFVRGHREMIPRNFVALNQRNQAALEQLSENVTRQGFTDSTLKYMNLCAILQPMQELMSQNKAYSISPRECLKTTLFQKWQQWTLPQSTIQTKLVNKRPKRKRSTNQPPTPASASSQPGTPTVTSAPVSTISGDVGGNPQKKISPGTPQIPNSPSSLSGGRASMSGSLVNLSSGAGLMTSSGPVYMTQDVMVVGEPSLMGGAFDEDERLITRSSKLMASPSLSWHDGKAIGQDEGLD
ncbi:LIM domain-binding protein 2-like isoform X2 [Corticium candelabrum]|uniref:LIM domain-binding protein 2-like isoform X2 n=1 Tax=Corticium candelabrum TaxID=121492 RepID=UPI002E253CC3|nr:LIM domain-binding protein 2-like isoform X2 [Corticium candelabrum]